MENNTALVVKQDGKVYAFNMPEKPNQNSSSYTVNGQTYKMGQEAWYGYDKAVEQAISSAVECADQVQAVSLIAHGQTILDIEKAKKHYCKPNHPYVIPGLTFTREEYCAECKTMSSENKCNKLPCTYYEKGYKVVALLSLTEIKEEKTEPKCNHRYDGQSIDGRVRCHWCGEVQEKTEKQELTDSEWYEFLYDIGSQVRLLKGETGPDEWEKMQAYIESKYIISFKKKVKS